MLLSLSHSYGKIKTAAQLVALSVLLGARAGCGWIRMTGASEIWLINSGLLCLWLSAGLASIFTVDLFGRGHEIYELKF